MAEIYMDVDAALSEVPVNIAALIDDTTFKDREQGVTYDQAGMDLLWNFVTTAGAYTQTAVTPTTGGDYDWTNQGNGMYSIEITASGGASINNDTEGFGWFTGFATGILPWRGPVIGFRAVALNNALIDGGDNLDVNVALWLEQAVTLSGNNFPDVNVNEISDDLTAPQNLELQYDGTGLVGDTFPSTQLQASNIVATGSTGKEPARLSPNGFVITLGENEANNEDATRPLDGTTHDIEAQLSGTEQIDVYYEFQIGSGTPSLVTWHGMLDRGGGAAKNITVQARDVDAATWRTIGTIVSGTSIISQTFDLFVGEVGTGANAGVVRIRFVTGSVAFTATTKLQTDQIFITHGLGAEGYELGAIWFDSTVSNTGTIKGIDGTATNPVSSMAAVNTLLAKTNLHRVEVASGSTVTLGAAQNDQLFNGVNWTLALASQDIAGTTFIGASVSGIAAGTGTKQQFINCLMGATSHIKGTHIVTCGIAGTQTVVEAGDFFFDRCHSAIAGTATWIFAFGAAIGNTNLNVRNYSGGIQLENMGDTGTDTASIEGRGQIIEGTCAGGTVAVRGAFSISGETNITFTETARMEINNIAVAAVDNWETQSQADPTGFHVNVLEIGGTAQTANDNGADINAILADTNELQGDWTNGGRLDLIIDAILADTNELQGDDVPGLIGALNDISAADVNAQVVDVMATDVQTLPGQAAPPNGPTYQEIWTWLYKAWRNKWDVDSGGGELYNDAGAVIDSKFTHSDDGSNYIRGEIVSGP